MDLLGEIILKGINIKKTPSKKTPLQQQIKQLKKLINKAKDTRFGHYYRFEEILNHRSVFLKPNNTRELYLSFKSEVPCFDYNKMYDEWWSQTHNDQKDITWPGRVKYYALSSGTSGAPSKYIPVTKDQLKAIKKTGVKQILDLKNFDFKASDFEKSILMLGGSTQLIKSKKHLEGDLSGITTSNLPFWMKSHYKPGNTIAKEQDWATKLDRIVKEAYKWDIGYVAGVPAWIQIMMEKIIAHYQLKNIHDLWPNLAGFCHGGVAFEPYKKSFEKLLGKPIKYIETYLASEGFFAYQESQNSDSMKLVLNGGVFYEFVPFNSQNFDDDGNLKHNAQTYMIDEIKENLDYAMLISTCAGAWRYLLGDTIKFTDAKKCEIKITGRTKHFLSLCGEHLSVENMNTAINVVAAEMNVSIKEFTVLGVSQDSLFAHEWYMGSNDKIDKKVFAKKLDATLKALNDDYKTERLHAIKKISVEVLPEAVFYDWLASKGKIGAQIKFPRVLKNEQVQDWKQFIGLMNV
jgi:hypothetical protein